jgi:hypothetical protein
MVVNVVEAEMRGGGGGDGGGLEVELPLRQLGSCTG